MSLLGILLSLLGLAGACGDLCVISVLFFVLIISFSSVLSWDGGCFCLILLMAFRAGCSIFFGFSSSFIFPNVFCLFDRGGFCVVLVFISLVLSGCTVFLDVVLGFFVVVEEVVDVPCVVNVPCCVVSFVFCLASGRDAWVSGSVLDTWDGMYSLPKSIGIELLLFDDFGGLEPFQ